MIKSPSLYHDNEKYQMKEEWIMNLIKCSLFTSSGMLLYFNFVKGDCGSSDACGHSV